MWLYLQKIKENRVTRGLPTPFHSIESAGIRINLRE